MLIDQMHRIALIANASSNDQERIRDLGKKIASAGGEQTQVRVFAAEARKLDKACQFAMDWNPELILVCGGDGTIRTVAQHVQSTQVIMGILPAGTMNLLARDAGLPLEPEAALSMYMAGCEAILIDAGSCNNQLFLHSVLMGGFCKTASIRERIRSTTSLGQRIMLAIAFVRHALRSSRASYTLSSGKDEKLVQAPGIIVTNGMLDEESPVLPRKRPLQGCDLGVYWSDHQGPLAAGRLMASVVHGMLDLEDRLCAVQVKAMTIQGTRRMTTVSLDGELLTFRGALRFRSLAGAVRMLVPASDRDQTDTEARVEPAGEAVIGVQSSESVESHPAQAERMS